MYEIEKRWYEGIRAGQSGGRGAASFREIRRWRVLFSPSSPPPKIRKLSVFPSVSALPPLPGRLPAPASLHFRVGQKKARSRKCEGSTPRRDATRDGREREKQSPPPQSNGGPLSSPGASLSLSLASSQNSVSPGVQPLPRHPRPCWLFLSSTCRGSRPLALTAEARKSKSGKKPTVKPQNRVILFFPSLCLLFPSSLSTASPRAPFTEPPPYPPPPP